jgi:hypothetical protein
MIAMITIEQRYHGCDEWTCIDEYDFLRRTEWAGYFPKGAALAALKTGEVRTPYAAYRIAED